VLRRGDHRGADGPDLTLAQLSILLTLLDQGPIRMTELAARERVRTPPPPWRSAGWRSSAWSNVPAIPRICAPSWSR
jgi:hypothetical protein